MTGVPDRRYFLLAALGLLAALLLGANLLDNPATRTESDRQAEEPPLPTTTLTPPSSFAATGWIVIDAIDGDRLTVRYQKPWQPQEPFTVLTGSVTLWATTTRGPEPLCPGVAIQAGGVRLSSGVFDARTIAVGYPHPECSY